MEEATSHLAASNKDFQLKHLFEKYSLGKQVRSTAKVSRSEVQPRE